MFQDLNYVREMVILRNDGGIFYLEMIGNHKSKEKKNYIPIYAKT